MAKTIKLTRRHGLGLDVAKARLEDIVAQVEARYGVGNTVRGDGANLEGKGVTGTIKVTGERVDVDLELRLPASLIAAKIQSGVEAALAQHFA